MKMKQIFTIILLALASTTYSQFLDNSNLGGTIIKQPGNPLGSMSAQIYQNILTGEVFFWDNTNWKKLGTESTDYKGSFTDFSFLPTTGVKSGDWAVTSNTLLLNTKGIYSYNGTVWIQDLDLDSGGVGDPTDELSDIGTGTTTQRDLTTPKKGDVWNNTTTSTTEHWDGVAWVGNEYPAGGTILELTDTPSTYAGKGGHNLRVNATEDGVEFVDSSPTIAIGTIYTHSKYGGSGTIPTSFSDGEHFSIENTNGIQSTITVTAEAGYEFVNGSYLGGITTLSLIPGEVIELVKDVNTNTYRVKSRWLGQPTQLPDFLATAGQTVLNVGKFKDYNLSLFELYVNGQKYSAEVITGAKITAYDGAAGTITVTALALGDLVSFKGLVR